MPEDTPRAEIERRLDQYIHDANNLLAGILGYASSIESQAVPGGEVHEAAAAIRQAAERAGELTAQLGESATPIVRRAVDLHAIVAEVSTLVRGTCGSRIQIRHELADGGAIASGDSSRLYQLVLNLVMNACDAMPEGGELWIRTRLDPDRDWILLEVADTGWGIRPEDLPRIFEPTFTTKAGKRSGIGLAIARSIVSVHGGRIEVESVLGKGATLRAILPGGPERSAAV